MKIIIPASHLPPTHTAPSAPWPLQTEKSPAALEETTGLIRQYRHLFQWLTG
jgi:hypothetical protein